MIYLAIMILSLIDIIATGIGVTRYGLEEGNPIVAYLFQYSVFWACAVAFAITGLMILIIHKAQKRIQKKWINIALSGVIAIKTIIVIMHIIWMAQI